MSSNIKYVRTATEDELPKPWIPPTEEQELHNKAIFEWCSRQMKEFFTEEEYGEVLSYRRSKNDDQAVIDDFFRTEQPYHQIPRDRNFDRGYQWTKKNFRPNRVLHPVAYPDLRYYPMTLNTNVEAPWNSRNWCFEPKDRNVDYESEIPKLCHTEEDVDKYKRLFEKYEEWRTKKLFDYLSDDLSERPDDRIEIDLWLRWKQELGINDSDSRIKHNLYPEILSYNRFLVHQIKDGLYPFWIKRNGKLIPQTYYWNTVHMRSHVVGPEEPDKIRAVFGATWLLLMCELMFVWVLQSHYLNHSDRGRLLWGHEIMRGGWRKLKMEGSKYGQPSTVLTVDWSQFDRRFLHELIDDVFDIWKTYFDFSHYEETSFYNGVRSLSDRHRINRLFEWVRNAVKHTPTLLPDGKLYMWTRNGFGSGYQMTQLMDTFANSIMITTCLAALGIEIELREFFLRIQGDDSLSTFFEQMFALYGSNFLDMLAEAALYYFNAKLNTKKSKITKNFDYQGVLGYTSKDGLPYRTTEDLLSHFLFPESRFDNFNKKCSVTVGLAYATCGTNERVYDFMKLCFRKMVEKGAQPHDKYLKWLERTGLLFMSASINTREFPDRYKMLDWLHCPHIRTEFEKERVWPTKVGSKGRFYFYEK